MPLPRFGAYLWEQYDEMGKAEEKQEIIDLTQSRYERDTRE